MALRVFGLTGGIGSGKSTVAERFLARGLPVVNADQLARLAVVPGSPGLRQIVEHFGAAVLTSEGELDRRQLGERVFSNLAARRALDAIVHPIVRALAAEQFSALADRGELLACYEVPLLYEVGLEGSLSPIVVVNAPGASIRARLALRDRLDDAQIEARIAAQLPLSEKARRADYVVVNDASLAQLRERADTALDAVCELARVPPERYQRPREALS